MLRRKSCVFILLLSGARGCFKIARFSSVPQMLFSHCFIHFHLPVHPCSHLFIHYECLGERERGEKTFHAEETAYRTHTGTKAWDYTLKPRGQAKCSGVLGINYRMIRGSRVVYVLRSIDQPVTDTWTESWSPQTVKSVLTRAVAVREGQCVTPVHWLGAG